MVGKLATYTLDNYQVRSPSQGRALRGCCKHDLHAAPRGVILYGPPGTGKTHLVVALINADLETDRPLGHLFVECLEFTPAGLSVGGRGTPGDRSACRA